MVWGHLLDGKGGIKTQIQTWVLQEGSVKEKASPLTAARLHPQGHVVCVRNLATDDRCRRSANPAPSQLEVEP